MSESLSASESIAACVCGIGYFDAALEPEEVVCERCPVGTTCPTSGMMLWEVIVDKGYYRANNNTIDLRRCPDATAKAPGCSGGVGEGSGPCKAWLMGPYCKLCNVTVDSRYYDSDTSSCLLCEGDAAAPLALFIVGVAILALLVGAFFRFRPDLNIAKLAKLSARARTLSTQLSLRAKIKQSVTRAQTVTHCPPPSCHRQSPWHRQAAPHPMSLRVRL